MEKLIREYQKNGFNVKIYTQEATENEKKTKKVAVKEKIINIVKNSLAKNT